MFSPKKTPIVSCLDILFLSPILAFAAWIYLIPPFETFGMHTLFSDDAIFAMMARKALEEGPQGAYHLSWGPLLSWLIALLNKLFLIPLDEGGRIITGASMFLRIIPAYFLAKYLLNRFAAVITAFLVTIYVFLLIPQEAALAEGLYSLFIFTGFFFSFQALRTDKIGWYFSSGLTWGLAYLTRLEGWFYIVPLLLLSGFKLMSKTNRILTLKLLFASIIGFLLISMPYLSFVRQAYGSWMLNPRMNISLVVPGNSFTLYKDNYGNSTPAQIYFSGDPKYYISNLWHPDPLTFWRAVGRSWAMTLPTPIAYYNFFQEKSMPLFVFGLLGIFITLYTAFRKRLQLLFLLIAVAGLGFILIDFSLITLEFLSPVIFNPEGNLQEAIKQFERVISLPEYQVWLRRDAIIAALTLFFIIIRRKQFSKIADQFYKERVKLYLPLSLFLGFVPLFFNSFAGKYTLGTGAIFALFSGVSIALTSSLIIKTANKIIPHFPHTLLVTIVQVLVLIGFFGLNYQQFNLTLDTRETQYKRQDFQISYLKNPGLAILKDHGPGAKIGVFHEAPVFYAQGVPFYFAADSNITLEQSINYLEENSVEYMVLNSSQYYSWKQLKPLFSSTTDLPNWKMIYSDAPAGKEIKITDTQSDVLVTVWKYIAD